MAVEGANLTLVSEFLFLGFSEDPKQQQLLFILFPSVYLVTELGNLLIILAIAVDVQLPYVLLHVVRWHRQLPADRYNRHVAICHPLHCATSVIPQLCSLLVAASWTETFGNALTYTISLTHLSFCIHNQAPHFFCDLSRLLKLACSDTFLNNAMVYTMGALPIITPFVGILVSYMHIFAAALRIPSTRGKRKTFSTCGSHLSVVSLFYGTLIRVYFSPMSSRMALKDITAAVMYTVVTPMLNPFIYSLRNNDMKGAVEALINKRPVFIR
ncbi:olfactory receptor [Pontoporia blainvillei]|uniref:Olfactory receptor n=1 Tax=Pontoporia blainvillei TaxID=48723 RepID=A0ABX0SDX6_PONBL|nr:olfactory receptor [Pontoporia blainvillei]